MSTGNPVDIQLNPPKRTVSQLKPATTVNAASAEPVAAAIFAPREESAPRAVRCGEQALSHIASVAGVVVSGNRDGNHSTSQQPQSKNLTT